MMLVLWVSANHRITWLTSTSLKVSSKIIHAQALSFNQKVVTPNAFGFQVHIRVSRLDIDLSYSLPCVHFIWTFPVNVAKKTIDTRYCYGSLLCRYCSAMRRCRCQFSHEWQRKNDESSQKKGALACGNAMVEARRLFRNNSHLNGFPQQQVHVYDIFKQLSAQTIEIPPNRPISEREMWLSNRYCIFDWWRP